MNLAGLPFRPRADLPSFVGSSSRSSGCPPASQAPNARRRSWSRGLRDTSGGVGHASLAAFAARDRTRPQLTLAALRAPRRPALRKARGRAWESRAQSPSSPDIATHPLPRFFGSFTDEVPGRSPCLGMFFLLKSVGRGFPRVASTTARVRRPTRQPRLLPRHCCELPASGADLVALASLETRRPFVSTQSACQFLSHTERPSGFVVSS